MSGKATKQRILKEWKEANSTCTMCGQQFHHSQLEAHHPNDDKNPKLGRNFQMIRLTRAEFDAELLKVVPVCRNCHAYHHYNERLSLEG